MQMKGEMKANKKKQKEHKEMMKKKFDTADINKDGKLDLTEFKAMMKACKDQMKEKFGEAMECS